MMGGNASILVKGVSYNMGLQNGYTDKIRQLRLSKSNSFMGIPLDEKFHNPKSLEEEAEGISGISQKCDGMFKYAFSRFHERGHFIWCLQEIPSIEKLKEYIGSLPYDIIVNDNKNCAIVYNTNEYKKYDGYMNKRFEDGNVKMESSYAYGLLEHILSGFIVQILSVKLCGYNLQHNKFQECGQHDLESALSIIDNEYPTIVAGDFNSPPNHGYPEYMLSEHQFMFQNNVLKTHYHGQLDHAYASKMTFRHQSSDMHQLLLIICLCSYDVIQTPSDHLPLFFSAIP